MASATASCHKTYSIMLDLPIPGVPVMNKRDCVTRDRAKHHGHGHLKLEKVFATAPEGHRTI